MRRALAPFRKLESSNHTQSSPDFINNTSGFSFRYTQRRFADEEAAILAELAAMAAPSRSGPR